VAVLRESEEIRVRAAVGGRELTLAPIRVVAVTLEVREVESTIPCGFQSVWGDAEGVGPDGAQHAIRLTSGAGFGSRWGTIDCDGRRFCFSADQLINAFVSALTETEGEA
jgi:hypothetical protein